MTQKERQERSRRAICQAALEEFGVYGFDAVTMDSICAKHGISKGMMYHYYANKDALFIACVQEIFQSLNGYIQQESERLVGQPVFEAIKNYFMIRESFFQFRSLEKHIFENAVLYPPKHLVENIQILRQPIRELNDQFIKRLISRIQLREGLDQKRALRYLNSLYALFWRILEQYHPKDAPMDLHTMLLECEEILEMVLLGIAQSCDADDILPSQV